MKRSRQLTLKQCHEILRLDKNAGLEELKSAYRKRAFELHPDLNPGNPNASHDFQLLNEAYVALSAVLKPAAEAQQKAEDRRRKAEESREERRRAEERARDAAENRRAREERERLIREQAQRRRAEEEAQEVTVTWSDKKPALSLRKGVAGAVKGWLRQQIDEEQEFTLPASNLVPGRRIRLRIRRGFSNDLVTVEITLPPDFTPGKPVRLRGLGKRVGPWQGDLYLKLNSQ